MQLIQISSTEYAENSLMMYSKKDILILIFLLTFLQMFLQQAGFYASFEPVPIQSD